MQTCVNPQPIWILYKLMFVTMLLLSKTKIKLITLERSPIDAELAISVSMSRQFTIQYHILGSINKTK